MSADRCWYCGSGHYVWYERADGASVCKACAIRLFPPDL